jgi:hypothetical protein
MTRSHPVWFVLVGLAAIGAVSGGLFATAILSAAVAAWLLLR